MEDAELPGVYEKRICLWMIDEETTEWLIHVSVNLLRWFATIINQVEWY